MRTPVLTPPALRRGDTVALISPSSRVQDIFPLRIARATAFLESQGFRVRSIHHELPATHAEAVETRVAELHEAFAAPEVRAVVCCIGGFSSNELVGRIDYELVRANPKIFVGSSDITQLHHAFYARAGLRTFYGPSAVTQLAEYPEPLPLTWRHFLHVLTNPGGADVGPMPRSTEWTDEFLDWMGEPANLRPREMQPGRGWRWLRPGAAEGTLWGGCLPSMLQPFATPSAVAVKGCVLLLELPEGEAPGAGWPMELARQNLADLGQKGVWKDIAGLVVGRPYRRSPKEVDEWEALVLDQTHGCTFPVLAGVDVGHTDPMLTVPLGARVRIDSEKDEWVVLERAVEPRE